MAANGRYWKWKDLMATEGGRGVNYRKVLLLCVNVFVSLRSVVLLSWDFLGGLG